MPRPDTCTTEAVEKKDRSAGTTATGHSRGELQAIAIARAMHLESDRIALDAPMNNLAAAASLGRFRRVREIRQSGDACAFVTIGIRHAFRLVARMVVMRRDELLADALSPGRSGIPDEDDIISSEELPA